MHKFTSNLLVRTLLIVVEVMTFSYPLFMVTSLVLLHSQKKHLRSLVTLELFFYTEMDQMIFKFNALLKLFLTMITFLVLPLRN